MSSSSSSPSLAPKDMAENVPQKNDSHPPIRQKDDDAGQNEKIHELNNNNNNEHTMTPRHNNSNTTSYPSCETCDSTKDCEEDVYNPGNYYCKSCWDEYANSQEEFQRQQQQQQQGRQQQQQQPQQTPDTENITDIKLSTYGSNSASTSPFMTPRGMSLNTQDETTTTTTTTATSMEGYYAAAATAINTQSQQSKQIQGTSMQGSQEPAAAQDDQDEYYYYGPGGTKGVGIGDDETNKVDDDDVVVSELKGGNCTRIAASNNDREDQGGMEVDGHGRRDENQRNENENVMRDETAMEMDGNMVNNKKEAEENTGEPTDHCEELAKHETNVAHDHNDDKFPLGAKKTIDIDDESQDIPPANGKDVIVVGGDETNVDMIDLTDDKSDVDESFDNDRSEVDENFDNVKTEEEAEDSFDVNDDSFLTQEGENNYDSAVMGSAYGLLTQKIDESDFGDDYDKNDRRHHDDDDDDDEISNAPTKSMADHDETERKHNSTDVGMAENIINAVEGNREDQPMIEAVTTTEKDIELSGLTEPTQSQQLVPRNKFPKFSTINGGAMSGEEKSQVSATSASPPPSSSRQVEKVPRDCENCYTSDRNSVEKPSDGENCGASSENSVDGSSAYRGLTEEDDNTAQGAPRDAGKEEDEEDPHHAEEEVATVSPRNANFHDDGNCDESRCEDKLGNATIQGEDGKMEVDEVAAANGVATDGDALEPAENETNDSDPKHQSEATPFENEDSIEEINKSPKVNLHAEDSGEKSLHEDKIGSATSEGKNVKMEVDDGGAGAATDGNALEPAENEINASDPKHESEATPLENKDGIEEINKSPKVNTHAEGNCEKSLHEDKIGSATSEGEDVKMEVDEIAAAAANGAATDGDALEPAENETNGSDPKHQSEATPLENKDGIEEINKSPKFNAHAEGSCEKSLLEDKIGSATSEGEDVKMEVDEIAAAAANGADGDALEPTENETNGYDPKHQNEATPLENEDSIEEINKSPKVNTHAEGSCEKSLLEDKIGSATSEREDGKMEVDEAAVAGDGLQPRENETNGPAPRERREATPPEDEESTEEPNEDGSQVAESMTEVGSDQMAIDDIENEVEHSTAVQQDNGASKQSGDSTALATKDCNKNSDEGCVPPSKSTVEEGNKSSIDAANSETKNSAAGQQDIESAPLKHKDCNGEDANDDDTSLGAESEGEHVEGTEDTLLTTGSGTGGWSLYGGDTQMLPTGPSQILATGGVAVADSSCQLNSVVNDVDYQRTNQKEEITVLEAPKQSADIFTTESLPKHGEKEANEKEVTGGGLGAADKEANNGLPNKETQKLNKPVVDEESVNAQENTKEPAAGGINECIEEKEPDDDHQHIALMDNLKHTPENGTLPISYPNDHLVDPTSHEKNACMDEDDGEDTQLSQVLLTASPKSHSHSLPQKPFQANGDDPPPSKLSLASKKHNSTILKHVTIEGNVSMEGRVAPSEKSTPKSPPQKEIVDETKWMSARQLHENQNDVNINRSSPRLLMPSFKPIHTKNSDDDEPTKCTALNNDAVDGSDNESWTASRRKYNSSDPIENTQDESEIERPSAFKRLSRGTSRSMAHDDSTFSKFSPQHERNNTPSDTTMRIIKPKVLRYDTVTKNEDASLSSASSESSPEAEFSDDDTNDVGGNFQQSQTDIRIMKQLEEVKAMAAKLPSAEEMNEIVSRKQLADEIAYLKKSHRKEINKLKRENSKLVAQLENAEETIKQKDQTIQQKTELLVQQSAFLADFKNKFGGVLPTTKCTTPTKSNKKRKKVDETPLDVDSDIDDDDDDDDDNVPLSDLKKADASSTDKRRRKSYGSRQATKIPSKKASTKKADRLPPNAAASVSVRSDDTYSAKTSPISNRTGVKKKKKQNILSPVIWKQLQEKGWKHKTGPEPHNKVYVPRDGATHPGTQLGIHFFDCDQVVNEAIKRGDYINSGSPEESVQPPPKISDTPANSTTSEPVRYPGHRVIESQSQLNDSELIGNSKLITLESAQFAIKAATDFVRNDERFKRSLFNPLWNRLRDQGPEDGLKWRYQPYRNCLSKDWCFVPPTSNLGAKGVLRKDYFLSEEEVVLCILEEVRTMKETRPVLNENAASISSLISTLTRAVDEDMEYQDAKLGKRASVRTCRLAKSSVQPGVDSSPKSVSKGKKQTSPKTKSKELTSSKKRAPKITPETKFESSKKQKTEAQSEEHLSPSFHQSQTQGVEDNRKTYNRRSPGQKNGPLSGYSFFFSGIDSTFLIEEKIKRLGGKPVPHNSLTVRKANNNAFFLSDYRSWRKTKYIYAAALGTPMLHYRWLVELEQEFKEKGEVRIFNSKLYIKYRLPVGLDLSRGIYPLQRASHARFWDPPGCMKGKGDTVFHGMTIALALDQKQDTDWKMILRACGATVKTLSDVQKGKGKINVDCCLFASTSLPPHVISTPAYVSKLMQYINDDVPLLDLAWAHQSIIQRKCLPLVGENRYSVSLDHSLSNKCQVFSIKKDRRYEVGDLVQFSRGPKTTSRGRVVGIVSERQGKGCKLEIQLLESNKGFELVDCPSTARIVVDESSLQGNILMLGTKDFYKLGYLPKNSDKSDIFDQVLPKESQM